MEKNVRRNGLSVKACCIAVYSSIGVLHYLKNAMFRFVVHAYRLHARLCVRVLVVLLTLYTTRKRKCKPIEGAHKSPERTGISSPPLPPRLCPCSCAPSPPSLQVLAVLEAMGGTLKADDAELAYKQEKKAKQARSAADLVRVTAMFSATMPPAVEKMAKKYLRHPAVVQVCIKSGERSQVPCTSRLQVFAVVQRPRGRTSQVEGLQTQGQQCARLLVPRKKVAGFLTHNGNTSRPQLCVGVVVVGTSAVYAPLGTKGAVEFWRTSSRPNPKPACTPARLNPPYLVPLFFVARPSLF